MDADEGVWPAGMEAGAGAMAAKKGVGGLKKEHLLGKQWLRTELPPEAGGFYHLFDAEGVPDLAAKFMQEPEETVAGFDPP
jgi:hypothetical protein